MTRARLVSIARVVTVVLFALASAIALAHGSAVGNEFQVFRGVLYGFVALALIVKRQS